MKRLLPVVVTFLAAGAGLLGSGSALHLAATAAGTTEAVNPSRGAGGGAAPAKAGDAQQLESAKAHADQDAAEALGENICRFLGEYAGTGPDARNVKPGMAAPEQQFQSFEPDLTGKYAYCPGVKQGAAFKVVIAILPDPVHTHLALRFDRSVDAVQNALQDLGWLYDGAWMPWERSEHVDAPNFEQRVLNDESLNAFQFNPGVMLFRGGSDSEQTSGEPLVMLTVGDTPTAGVNARQFRKAVEIWKRLVEFDQQREPADKKPTVADHLMILGPTYTGSVRSLKKLIVEVTKIDPQGVVAHNSLVEFGCPARPFRITISSGTVSASSDVDSLMRGVGCPGLQVSARSFAVDLEYEYTQVLRFLARHGVGTNVGVLSEEESGFGDIAADQPQYQNHEHIEKIRGEARKGLVEAENEFPDAAAFFHHHKASPHNPEQEERSRKLLEDLNVTTDQTNRFEKAATVSLEANLKRFSFPREISTLRSAYEQNGIFGYGTSADATKTQLHLNISGDARGDDTVHTFAGKQGAAAMEAQMGQLALALDEQRISIVLLSATDPLDEMFVTRYLADHAPNVSVVVLDADNLFLRSGSSGMQNVYIVSPWPLIAENERWSEPKYPYLAAELPNARLFPSSSAQGLYDAARVLLCDREVNGRTPDIACGFQFGESGVSLRDYQPPIGLHEAGTSDLLTGPPLWLSSVSQGRFWPISLIDVDQMKDCLPESAWFNLPPMNPSTHSSVGDCTPGIGPKSDLQSLPNIHSRGIVVSAQRSVKALMLLIALGLVWHAFACLRCRLDRQFAWSYALSDEEHRGVRLAMQAAIALSAIPALVLLCPPGTDEMTLRSSTDLIAAGLLQGLAVLVAVVPVYLWANRGNWVIKAEDLGKTLLRLVMGLLPVVTWVILCNTTLWPLLKPVAENPTERLFFLYRAAVPLSGTSPVLPLLLLGAALVVALTNGFGRLVFYEHRIPRLPDSTGTSNAPPDAAVANLNGFLSSFTDRWRVGLMIGIVLCLVILSLYTRVAPKSLSHGPFDRAMTLLAMFVLSLLLHDLATASLAWNSLRTNCLQPLARSPLRWGFTWIKGFSWKLIWAPGAMAREQILRYLVRLSQANTRTLRDSPLTLALGNLREAYDLDPKGLDWASHVTQKLGAAHEALAEAARFQLTELSGMWSRDHGPLTGETVLERGYPEQKTLATVGEADRELLLDRMAREEFVALLYVGYIRMVLLQVRNRLLTASYLYVLLLWSLTSYPFLNHHSLLIGLSALLILMAVVVIVIVGQMHKDEILSRTTETTTGSLGSDFFLKVLGMVGVPLLTLVATQFPELSNIVFSWLEPGLTAIK